MNNTGVVIVCFNTPGLISRAVESVSPFVWRVQIIDHSEKQNPCYRECDGLARRLRNVFVHHTGVNIGHGPGLNLGIGKLNTRYVICMDSDAELLDPTMIAEMKKALNDESVYGCGRVLGLMEGIDYLYLPFCMFRKSVFMKHSPFIHDGAPFIRTMREIHGKLRLVQIPNFERRLLHDGRATRKVAGHWRKGFGGKPGV